MMLAVVITVATEGNLLVQGDLGEAGRQEVQPTAWIPAAPDEQLSSCLQS